MRSVSFADAPSVSAEAAPAQLSALGLLISYLRNTLVITEIDLRKLRHDPLELVSRAIQPAIWLTIFGQALASLRAIPTGEVGYVAFITPGILAQSVMSVAIFSGLTIIWDRDQGILQKLLVMPIPHASFVAGKALGAGLRALSQAVAIFLLAMGLGVQLHWSIGGIVGALLTVVVGSAVFTTGSMLLAIAVRTRERFMGLGQLISMPLFFASNAIYPLAIMPPWLQIMARLNPLSYIVELLRGYLIVGATPTATLDWSILITILIVLQALASRLLRYIVV